MDEKDYIKYKFNCKTMEDLLPLKINLVKTNSSFVRTSLEPYPDSSSAQTVIRIASGQVISYRYYLPCSMASNIDIEFL